MVEIWLLLPTSTTESPNMNIAGTSGCPWAIIESDRTRRKIKNGPKIELEKPIIDIIITLYLSKEKFNSYMKNFNTIYACFYGIDLSWSSFIFNFWRQNGFGHEVR